MAGSRAPANRVPAVHFRGTEALRALVFTRCQDAFGLDSPVATAIASEVSEDELQLLASDETLEPRVSVRTGRFLYDIVLDRAALDNVLHQLDELPR